MVIFLPLHPLGAVGVSRHRYHGEHGRPLRVRSAAQMARRGGRFFRIFSTVTSHDRHHTNMRVNYAAFFNVWDRICGTYQADGEPEKAEAASKSSGAAPLKLLAQRRS